jgi:hypothetical protein
MRSNLLVGLVQKAKLLTGGYNNYYSKITDGTFFFAGAIDKRMLTYADVC